MRSTHYLWAVLIARIYEAFSVAVSELRWADWPDRLSITHSADIRQIFDHIGVDSQPPHIAPAHGPSLWDDDDAQIGEGVAVEPDWATDWSEAAQPAPDYEVDQRINWCVNKTAVG